MTSYNYSYNVLINRLEAFAAGHFLIKRFTHGQIDLADQLQDDQYPFMHVTPDTITPIQGGMQFGFLVMFADIPRDKEYKAEYQREVISDCIRLGQDLIAEVRNGLELFGFDVQLVNIPTFEPFIEEYKNTVTGVAFTLTLEVPWDWSACDIPAVWAVGGSSSGGSGTGYGLTLRTNGVDNAVQNILDLVEGTNVTITDNGDGSVTIDAAGGGASGEFVSTEYNVNHTTATGNPYQIGDRVWYNGSIYRCIANNDAINPTNPSYWTLVAVGYRLRQTPVDWNATSGDYQILNKPTIPATIVEDVTATSPILSSGGATPDISIQPSNLFQDGYLTSADFTAFYNKFDVPTGSASDYLDGTGAPVAFPSIPTNLDDLADVNAATPTTNNVLYWNGSVWKNGEVPLDALSNVTVPAPTNGQVLTYDTATNTWVAATPSAGSGTVTSVGTTGLISGGPITTSGTITTSMNTNKLVGRYAAGNGIMQEITVGSGLTLTGAGVLNNTATPTPTGYYGAWQDVTTQSAAASNVGYPMKFGTIDLENQVRIVTDGTNLTRITFDNTGIYNLNFSVQIQNTDNAEHDVSIWIRKNGVDIPGSTGYITVPKRRSTGAGLEGHTVAGWNYLLSVVGGEYYQLVWSTTNHTNVTLQFYSAGDPPPSTASTLAIVTQQSGIMAGTGITAINSLTDAVQTLGTGTSGTDFGIVSSGTSHTFNLPTASATNRGALSSANWSTFNGKQDALVSGTNIKTVNSTSLLGSGNVSVGTVTSVGGTGTTAGLSLSGTVTGSGNITLGGTLSTPVSTINDSTTVGQNLVKLPNPSAVRYLRINADNTVSALTLSELKADIGVGGYAVLTSDFITSGTAYQNITGLSFAVSAGKTYKWRATIIIVATGAVNGMLSTNGPAGTTTYRFTIGTGGTTNTISNGSANNTGSAVSISTTQRIASADGIYIATANGTVSMSVIASVNALVTIKAGSIVEFEEVA